MKRKIRFVVTPSRNGNWTAEYQEHYDHAWRSIERASGPTPEVAMRRLSLERAMENENTL